MSSVMHFCEIMFLGAILADFSYFDWHAIFVSLKSFFDNLRAFLMVIYFCKMNTSSFLQVGRLKLAQHSI